MQPLDSHPPIKRHRPRVVADDAIPCRVTPAAPTSGDTLRNGSIERLPTWRRAGATYNVAPAMDIRGGATIVRRDQASNSSGEQVSQH